MDKASRHARQRASLLAWFCGVFLICAAIASAGPAVMASAGGPTTAVADPAILRLAEAAKAAFRRRMEPPVIELTVVDIMARDATAVVRDYVRQAYDEAVDALIALSRAPEQARPVKAALRQLVDTGDADRADALFTDIAEAKAAEGGAAKRKAAACLRHSVALEALPAAMLPLIRLPSEALMFAPGGEKAEPAFARAAELDPGNAWTWIILAGLTKSPEVFDRAMQHAARAAQAADDRRAMIVALFVSGLARSGGGGHVQAEQSYRFALSVARQWAGEAPADDRAQRYVSLALNRLADALAAQMRHPEAAAAYSEALSVRARLAAAEPEDAQRQIDLISVHMNLWALYGAAENPAQGKAHLDEAFRLYHALAARDPLRPSIRALQSGQLATVLIAAGALTLVIGFIALARYRRLIRRYMLTAASTTGAEVAGQDIAGRSQPPVPTDLPLLTVSADARPEPALPLQSAAMAGAARASRRAAWALALAGGAFACVGAVLWLNASGLELSPGRFIMIVLGYVWPVVFVLALLWGPDRRRLAWAVFAYLAVLLAFCTYVAMTDTPAMKTWGVNIPPFFQPAFSVAIEAAPSLFLLLFLNRQVRAIGPVLLVLMVIVCAGSIALMVAASTYAGLQVLAGLSALLNEILGAEWPSAVVSLIGVHLLGALLFLPLGWLAIRWLRRRYDRKRFSEQTLVLDSIWVFQSLVLCLHTVLAAGPAGWLALGSFVAYKLAAWLGLRPLAKAAAARPPARLLLLRTFGFRRRSERFFDLLGARWRYAGPIQLIAAPDLASRSIDPDEFLDFLSGRLRHRFIIEPGDLERRFAQIDNGPDPDGRFRVNEFFCGNDAWRPAVIRLMAESDMVVMDLRGFSTGNQGCLFELQSLIDIVPVARVVLLTDGSTDTPFLRETLARCWQQMESASPNRRPAGALTVLETGGGDVGAVDALLRIADGVLAATATVPPRPAAVQPVAAPSAVTTAAGGHQSFISHS
jgi:tetratricopeptide (TPR) repeat protein